MPTINLPNSDRSITPYTLTGEPIPFDEALKRMLAAPPAHKVAAKKPAAKPVTKGKKKAR